MSGAVPAHQYGAPAGSFCAGVSAPEGPKRGGSLAPLPSSVTVWKPITLNVTLSPFLTVTVVGSSVLYSTPVRSKLPQFAFAVAALARLGTSSAAPTAPAPMSTRRPLPERNAMEVPLVSVLRQDGSPESAMG